VLKKTGVPSLVVETNWIRENYFILQSEGTKLIVSFGKKNKKIFAFNCNSQTGTVKLNGTKMKGKVDTGSTSSDLGKGLLSPALLRGKFSTAVSFYCYCQKKERWKLASELVFLYEKINWLDPFVALCNCKKGIFIM